MYFTPPGLLSPWNCLKVSPLSPFVPQQCALTLPTWRKNTSFLHDAIISWNHLEALQVTHVWYYNYLIRYLCLFPYEHRKIQLTAPTTQGWGCFRGHLQGVSPSTAAGFQDFIQLGTASIQCFPSALGSPCDVNFLIFFHPKNSKKLREKIEKNDPDPKI